jgi:hypothetical protein
MIEATMITRWLAFTMPEPGAASRRLNEVAPNAILPGDWTYAGVPPWADDPRQPRTRLPEWVGGR